MKIGLVILLAGLAGALFGLAAAWFGLPGWVAGAAAGMLVPLLWRLVSGRHPKQ